MQSIPDGQNVGLLNKTGSITVLCPAMLEPEAEGKKINTDPVFIEKFETWKKIETCEFFALMFIYKVC